MEKSNNPTKINKTDKVIARILVYSIFCIFILILLLVIGSLAYAAYTGFNYIF